MKYANKLMLVPYNYMYDTPIKSYLSMLDEEMDNVLKKELPPDEKVKLYTNILIKFKENFDPNFYENQSKDIEKLSSLIDNVKKENKETITSLLEDVKKENKETDYELKEQYNNLNVKLEQLNDDKQLIEKKIKKDLLDKSISKAKKINKERVKLKAKRIRGNDSKIEETLLEPKKLKNNENINESSMDFEDSDLNNAFNKTKGVTTRSQSIDNKLKGNGKLKWKLIKHFK